MRTLYTHQQLNLTLLLTFFLLLIFAEKSIAQCNIDFLTYQTNYISNDSISICYDFISENNSSNTYNVLLNNKQVKTGDYTKLETDRCFTISKSEFGINNQLLVQDAEELSCSDAIGINVVFDTFQSGTACFKNFSVEKTDCDENSGFFIKLDFISSYYPEDGSFSIFSNNREMGNYKYTDLPITIGPYYKVQQIDFNFKDTEYFCGGNIQVYTGGCGVSFDPQDQLSCTISNLNAIQIQCPNEQNKASVVLDFDHTNEEKENFYLIYYYDDLNIDSTLYQYADLPIEMGDLNGDGFTSYGIAIADVSNIFCKSELFLSELSCVFPGNTNGDINNTVNHIDLLKIGEAFGENGPARLEATVNPTAQIAESWHSFFNDGWNYKHADCNGNGVIDKKDALIIKQNYSKKSFKNEDHKYLNFKNKGLPIGVEVPNGNVNAYSEISLPIVFGQHNNLVDGLYGIAFSLNIDTNYIDPNSIRLDLNDSWLNSDTDEVLSIFEFNEFDSQLNVSLTKTNGKSTSGYGNIANLRIMIMVEIELEKRADDFEVTIEDVVISDKSFGYESIVNKGLLKIESKATIITEIQDVNTGFHFEVYPNPAYGKLNINANSQLTTNVEIVNLIGSTVYSNNFKSNTIINTDSWPSGIYTLHLDDGKLYQKKKILVR